MASAAKRPIESSPLYNKDLAPTDPARRTWGTYNFAALWISMAHCIPTYMLASGHVGDSKINPVVDGVRMFRELLSIRWNGVSGKYAKAVATQVAAR